MKIHLTQQVGIEGDRFPHNWRKDYDSTVIPSIGMYVEDPIWKDPGEYKVVDVIINYYGDYCYVALEKYDVEIPKVRKDEFAHMANLHGWECSWTQYEM